MDVKERVEDCPPLSTLRTLSFTLTEADSLMNTLKEQISELKKKVDYLKVLVSVKLRAFECVELHFKVNSHRVQYSIPHNSFSEQNVKRSEQ